MKKLSTWILVMFAVMFWGFRIIVTITHQLNIDFGGIVPINENLEIVLLFIVLFSLIFIVKRKLIGGLIYLLSYGLYFGTSLVTGITALINGETNMMLALNTFISSIGIILPILIIGDLMLDKNRQDNPKDSKTDWFFANEKFDREKDDRDDSNNYRTM